MFDQRDIARILYVFVNLPARSSGGLPALLTLGAEFGGRPDFEFFCNRHPGYLFDVDIPMGCVHMTP